MSRGAGGSTKRRRSRRAYTRPQKFLAVALADLAACQALSLLGFAQGVWLINLPATVSIGWVAGRLAGDAAALAVTVPAGAALYGWAAASSRRVQRNRPVGFPAQASLSH